MSPAYHERADALERFTEWFDSPVYESLLRCSSWRIRGAVATREAMQETRLPDGRIFLGSAPVEQVLRVEVVPGVSKWASARVTGARIGRALPPVTYEWTLGLQPDGSWTVDRIVPEAPVRVPRSIAAPLEERAERAGRRAEEREAEVGWFSPQAAEEGVTARPSAEAAGRPSSEEGEGSGAGAAAVALVSAVLLLSAGRWLGEMTGVFGASLDPAYFDEAPAKVTLRNLLD